ncbi:hypothetical protein OOZ15_20015, partial [Galbibacter sp. EGI 63066]|nr:hypothetical protein [Galbibacter sp. EGI 63066]
PIYSDVHALQANVEANERFGLIELQGGKYTDDVPLVSAEAVLDDAYYTAQIYPLVYKGYPLEGKFTVDRDVKGLGLPPKKAIDILTWYPMYLEHNISHSLMAIRLPYRYYLPYHYKKDFTRIQYKVVNAYLQQPSLYAGKVQQYNHIINGVFPSIPTGDYKVRLQYTLPGGIKGSNQVFKYNNPF